MNKYKLTKETIEHNGTTLYHIKALKDFNGVKKGDLGGYVEKEDNLSQSGNAWVHGNARVFGHARVDGNAWVYGNAEVFGNAKVSGDAKVYGNAWVFANAWVYGNARVFGNAWVFNDAVITEKCTGVSKVITGFRWVIIITDNHIRIGCECNTKSQWKRFSNKRINAMDKNALEFWKKYKESILTLAKA